ncbi:MAG TPA: response regulator, partial [Polyangiaceae bacterium]
DRSGARELVEAFAQDLQVEPVPLVVVGDFTSPEAASAYIALGAARVLAKPVSTEMLQRTVIELRAQTAEARTGRDPLGELSVAALADRIALEVRRGLLDAVEPGARGTSVAFGDGADVMAAVWGAVARVRELVTLRSSGAVRFDSSGPEGAVPMAAWGTEERRAGERGASAGEARAGDQVSLHGRRIVIADDDPAVVWFMSGLLKALGVEVLEAHDGARALALTYDTWPDLVVSDVLMPKLDGFSLCHEIKRDVAVRDVPVILLSWKEDLLQRVRELGASADGYLRKEAAAATVAERLREVLRPRARVEQRMAAGGDARGRLDGLTPRLILELASAGEKDVRVGIRDAAYLYEVQVRRGRLCSATRSSADGSFERGEFVLAALLGVSAGRFIVEPDTSHCRLDFEGTAAQILKAPIERARAALSSISAAALVGVTRVEVAANTLEGYLGCTPEPARSLLAKIIAGASPRELITSGSVAPRLLEAVLSDIARRGAITSIERAGDEPAPMRGSSPPSPAVQSLSLPSPPVVSPSLPSLPAVSPSLAAPRVAPMPSLAPKADDVTAEDAGWFSLQLDSSRPPPPPAEPVNVHVPVDVPAPVLSPPPAAASEMAPASAPPVSQKPKGLPFSSEVTPATDRRWDRITEGVFGAAPETLQGVGMPEVARSPSVVPAPIVAVAPVAAAVEPAKPPRPDPAPARSKLVSVEELDALASALTEPSPSPVPVVEPEPEPQPDPDAAEAATVAAPAPRVSEAPTAPPVSASPASAPAPAELQATLVSRLESQPPNASSRVSPLKTPTPPARVPAASANAGWLIRLVFVAGAAFAVAYFLVSYYRMQSAPDAGAQPSVPAPLPASS